MDRSEADGPSWRIALLARSGVTAAVLEVAQAAGARLRLMALPAGGGPLVIEIEGPVWPLDPDSIHPVVVRLSSGARWPGQLRRLDPASMQVTLPAEGRRALAALHAARWLRLEHPRHALLLVLPPAEALVALRTLVS